MRRILTLMKRRRSSSRVKKEAIDDAHLEYTEIDGVGEEEGEEV